MAGIYDLTLSAGTSPQNIGALGSYLKVISAPSGPVRIRFDGGEQVQLAAGQGRRFAPGQAFRDIQVTNAAGVAQTVLIFIGDSTFEDSTVTGNVSVIDQSIDKTRQGKQFHGTTTAAAVAGVVSLCYVVPGAAVTLAIKAIAVQSATAGDIMIGVGAGDGTVITGGTYNAMRNKLINAALSSSLRGFGQSAGATPTAPEAPSYLTMSRVYVPANQIIQVPLTTPMVLAGTARLYVSGLAVNRDVSMLIDAEEA